MVNDLSPIWIFFVLSSMKSIECGLPLKRDHLSQVNCCQALGSPKFMYLRSQLLTKQIEETRQRHSSNRMTISEQKK